MLNHSIPIPKLYSINNQSTTKIFENTKVFYKCSNSKSLQEKFFMSDTDVVKSVEHTKVIRGIRAIPLPPHTSHTISTRPQQLTTIKVVRTNMIDIVTETNRVDRIDKIVRTTNIVRIVITYLGVGRVSKKS